MQSIPMIQQNGGFTNKWIDKIHTILLVSAYVVNIKPIYIIT